MGVSFKPGKNPAGELLAKQEIKEAREEIKTLKEEMKALRKQLADLEKSEGEVV